MVLWLTQVGETFHAIRILRLGDSIDDFVYTNGTFAERVRVKANITLNGTIMGALTGRIEEKFY